MHTPPSPGWWQSSMHTECVSSEMVDPLMQLQAGVLDLHGCPMGVGEAKLEMMVGSLAWPE